MKRILTLATLLVSGNLFAQFPTILTRGGSININEYITVTALGYTSTYGGGINIYASWDEAWYGPDSNLEVYASAPQSSAVMPSTLELIGTGSVYDWGWFSCGCETTYTSGLRSLTISDVGKFVFVKYVFNDGTNLSTEVIDTISIGFTSDKIQVYEDLLNSYLSNTNQGYYNVLDVENISDSGNISVFQGGSYFLDIGQGVDTTFTDTFVWGTITFNQSKLLCDHGIVAGKRNLNSFVFKFEDTSCNTTNLGVSGYQTLFSIIKVYAPNPYTFTYLFSGVKITVFK